MSKNHRMLSGWQWERLRRAAFDRDGWRCQDCGKAAAMEAHHVKPLEDGGANTVENLLTLCRDCHIRAHRALMPLDPWDALIRERV